MVSILAIVAIEDLPRFMSVFSTRGARVRRLHGSVRSQVYAACDDPSRVVLILDWNSREEFERFASNEEVRETMRSGGTIGRPEFTVLEHVADFPS